MRPSYVGLVLVALCVGGLTAFRVHDQSQLSPFPLWTVRTGMRFQAMDDEASREMKRRFACRPAGAGVRTCELATDGPPGRMRVVVDERGRAVVVRFEVADTTLKMREEARRLAAEWDLVSPGQPHGAGTARTSTRWVSGGGRWSAEMHPGQVDPIPSAITLVDEPALARIVAASVPALAALVGQGIVSDTALAAAERREPGALARAADSITAAGRTLARAAAALPHCGADPLGGPRGLPDSSGGALAPEVAAVAAQAVAAAYPGTRLVVGARATYAVGPAGAVEEIRLAPSARNEEGDQYAFAVTFPARSDAAERTATSFGGGSRCRAPSEIVVARYDSAAGAVTGIRRVDVDGDALASRVRALDFVLTDDGRAMLVADYAATYGTRDWFGVVHWQQLVAGESALRVVRRTADGYTKTDGVAGRTEGVLVDARGRRDAAGAAPDDVPGVARLRVVTRGDATPPAKQLFLPAGASGLSSGWTLLDLL